jgi:choice-of-anchor B domain-containing protein
MYRWTVPASLIAGVILSIATSAQTNIGFVGQLNYQQLRNSDLSNLWGYTDEMGNEYAIVGVNGNNGGSSGGVSVVDLSDPASPQEIYFAPGPASIWREVKVWNDHAYITTEANNGGVTIIDLSPLPQSTALTHTVFIADDWDTSHSLFIDENGRLYIFGASRGNGGAIMFDLTQDPMAPVEVGVFDQWYVHDGFARGDTLYAAHIQDGFFSVVDVSDPSSPQLLGSQVTPNVFSHNVWLDDSGQYIFTTDEKPNAYVGAYDVSDPTDIQYLDKLQSDPGSNTVPHNTYWLNDFLVTSYYTYGVVIYDAMRPHNLVEVGHYDTSPFNGEGFNGAWGVYPFFGSERLIISDIQQGLIILDPTYVRACWLEGTITNAVTSAPVSQAILTIVGPGISEISALDGTYATGHHTAGFYTVTVSAAGYVTQTLTNVELINGVVNLLNVQLTPLASFSLQGSVIDAVTGDGIAGAQVVVKNDVYYFSATADNDGMFAMPAVFEDEYEVIAGQWGWITECPPMQMIGPGSEPLEIELEKGYYDDFELDFNWSMSGDASSGDWQRGIPIGTNYQGQASNPGVDVNSDCGDMAMVTGNGGGNAGDDDVDDGSVILTSPPFDVSAMLDPHIRYHRWFFNAGGTGTVNDRMDVYLTNGNDTAQIEFVGVGPGSNTWQQTQVRILDHMPLGDDLRFFAVALDISPGHLVEAGLDLFTIVELGPIGLQENDQDGQVQLWPNPNNGNFTIDIPKNCDRIQIYDSMGRCVFTSNANGRNRMELSIELSPGVHLLQIQSSGGGSQVRSFVVE